MRARICVFICIALAGVLLIAQQPNYVTWTGYLGGADSSQFTSLKQINRSNVNQLEVAWTYSTGDRRYLFNPVVIDSTMYVLAKNNAIVALEAATGKEIWTHENTGSVGTRGFNYWESKDRSDRRILFLNAGFLTAIDAKTGKTIQTFGDNGRTDLRLGMDRPLEDIPNMQTDNPGRVFENTLIMPLPARGDNYAAFPADVHAYDVRTGKLVWQFHSVPRPGEFGYETWPKDFWKTSGGVHNWNEMTVDEKRGIAFIPFGTARFDFYGVNRKGQNLFANSLVALDARTGKRLWHYQLVHHDLWDYDLPTAPKLLTVKHDGKNVDVVAQPTKQGFLFVFNRVTGEPLWPIEERPVPKSDVPGEESWPTQPFPTKPPAFARQSFKESDINAYLSDEDKAKLHEAFKTYRNEGLFTPPSVQGSIEMPGNNGGANWGSSGVNPTKGMIYIVSKEVPMILQVRPAGGRGAGGGRGKGGDKAAPPPPPPPPLVVDGKEYPRLDAPYNFMMQSNGLSAIGPPWSQLTAIDLNTGTIKWQVPNGTVPGVTDKGDTGAHFPRGGVLVTGGGLVFVATASDRMIRAYDEDNGKVVWSKEMPTGAEGVPAAYEVAGREYLVFCIAAGNGMMQVRLPGTKPAAPTTANAYVAFALPTKK